MREIQLLAWLRQSCGLSDFTFKAASDDASFRRYFRIQLPDGASRIVMDAPPDKEDCRPFIEITQRLQKTGVHVPHIYAQNIAQGFLLLEDLGTDLYLSRLNPNTVNKLYGDAIKALLQIQTAEIATSLPPYNAELLKFEMDLFTNWLLRQHISLTLNNQEKKLLDQTFAILIEHALQQPQVLVHRDYHSRNLLVSAPHNPGIIDYQDAVLGPITYDLVSLLRDCYISWPLEQVESWVKNYADQARAIKLLDADQQAQIPLWFDLMGVQRHLKAAGIFARLHHRDGKSGYLGDIPRTLNYILQVAQQRPEIAGLGGFIQRRVLPAIG